MFRRLTLAGYSGWRLNNRQRRELLRLFPPTHPNIVADHVTYKVGVDPKTPLPGARNGFVVGIADADGVQALVVAVNGRTLRPDGGTYHITWSLEPGKSPSASNALLLQGFKNVKPYALSLTPTYFK